MPRRATSMYMACKKCQGLTELRELYACGVCGTAVCLKCLPSKEYALCPSCYEEEVEKAKENVRDVFGVNDGTA